VEKPKITVVLKPGGLPVDIEPFASKPDETLQEQSARWKEYARQIDKKLELARSTSSS